MIRGLNHITLAVRDLDRALAFYRDTLQLRVEKIWDQGAYLSAGSLWLCLSQDSSAQKRTDYTHFAFDVSQQAFAATADRIVKSGAEIWKANLSEGASLYFCDPDGHQLELHVGTLASRLSAMKRELETC